MFIALWVMCIALTNAPNSFALPQQTVLSAITPDDDYYSQHIRYAAFGDSWASGVNYGPPSEDREYNFPDNDEVCRCRRMNEAYPVQLSRDEDFQNPSNSFTRGKKLDLDFVACHGTFFDQLPDQITRLNQSYAPNFATLMIGGNNAGFPSIVEDCIFQFNKDRDYGPEYPHPDSACTKTLARAHADLAATWFRDGIVDSIKAILSEPRIKTDPHFRIYVLSYAGLFNHDDASCDDWSFGVWPGKQPKLTRVLRRDINQVIDAGRLLYWQVINFMIFDPRVRYMDINSAFMGHRFCEPTDEGTIEAQAQRSWLWGMDWPDCIPLVAGEHEKSEGDASIEGTSKHNEIKPELWPQFCRKCGAGLGELGELQRPFHPKPEGHDAIKKLLRVVLETEPLSHEEHIEL